MPKRNNPGCNCCGSTLTVTVMSPCSGGGVPGSAPLPGATVTATQGATTLTGTTNSAGKVVFALPSTGSWDLAAGKARFDAGTHTLVVTGPTASYTFTLAVSSGYACINHGCVDPAATTLYVTDGWTNPTLTWSASGGFVTGPAWRACVLYTYPGPRATSSCAPGTTTGGTVPVLIEFDGSGLYYSIPTYLGRPIQGMTCAQAFGGPGCTGPDGYQQAFFLAPGGHPQSCPPALLWQASSFVDSTVLGNFGPWSSPHTQTFTITE